MLIDRLWNKIERDHYRRDFTSRVKCEDMPSVHGRVTVNATDVKAGKNLSIYPGAYFWGDGPIEIGDNVDIGKDTILYAHKGGGVKIGSNVAIAAQCYIIDSNHGTAVNDLIRNQPMDVSPITIEDDVWIAAGVKVLKGVTLHKGCVCAAGAVITQDVPENEIWGGVPAKRISMRKLISEV